jgi:hypothetical protein
METNQELQALLASIGLKEVMVEKDSIDPFDSEIIYNLYPGRIFAIRKKRDG